MGTDATNRALVLSPEAAYPLAGGGALRTASLLEYLAQRYTIDLIVFRQPGAADPAADLPSGLVRRVTTLPLPGHRRHKAARAWRNAARVARGIPPLVDRFAGFERQVAQAVQGCSYDVGLIEHFWCAPYLDVIAGVCRRTILDLHNVESVLHARSAAVTGFAESLAHHVFRRASLQLERAWLPRFSDVLATSAADAGTVRAIAPYARVCVYPNALPWRPPPPARHSAEQVVVFSGNMEYYPNLSAVRFFRAEVWPQLRARWPNLVWRLVGKNPEAIAHLVAGDERIEIRGPVEDAIGELSCATVSVVPLLVGSGTRFKILEAWAAGVAVVSSTIGAEGIPVAHERDILLADRGATFAEAVSRLLACPELRERLAAAGRSLLEKEFTWDVAWRNLNF